MCSLQQMNPYYVPLGLWPFSFTLCYPHNSVGLLSGLPLLTMTISAPFLPQLQQKNCHPRRCLPNNASHQFPIQTKVCSLEVQDGTSIDPLLYLFNNWELCKLVNCCALESFQLLHHPKSPSLLTNSRSIKSSSLSGSVTLGIYRIFPYLLSCTSSKPQGSWSRL